MQARVPGTLVHLLIIIIIILDPPMVNAVSPLMVYRYDSLTVDCQVYGKPLPTVAWYFNDGEERERERERERREVILIYCFRYY